MAQFFLLLRVRLKLTLRRQFGQRGMAIFMLLGMAVIGSIATYIGIILAREHELLSAENSQKLLDLTCLVITVFLVASPLMGFRNNEAMDITKLFPLPIRPAQLFLSMVIGQLFAGTTLIFLPVLLIPVMGSAADTAQMLTILAATLLYFLLLYALTQCLLLALLNVLRSRRFRDIITIIAPCLGLAMYLGLRFAMHTGSGFDGHFDMEALLDRVDFGAYAFALPPLWFSRAIHGQGTEQALCFAVLIGLAVLLTRLGLTLTVKAFHGEISLTPSDKGARVRHGLVRRLLSAILPLGICAVYGKELDTLKREPFLRGLFIQQLGLVVFFLIIGLTVEQERGGIGLVGAAIALVFVESGFLQNILGLEGPAFRHTASLPLRCSTLLLGKNLAHLHILGLTNLIFVPCLGLLHSQLTGEAYPKEEIALLLAIDLAVLPILAGAGNLISTLLPQPVAARGRRALGQERMGNAGCMNILLRAVFSFLSLLPALLVGLVFVAPGFLYAEEGLKGAWRYLPVTVPLGFLLSLLCYGGMTLLASRILQRNWHAVLARLG